MSKNHIYQYNSVLNIWYLDKTAPQSNKVTNYIYVIIAVTKS